MSVAFTEEWAVYIRSTKNNLEAAAKIAQDFSDNYIVKKGCYDQSDYFKNIARQFRDELKHVHYSKTDEKGTINITYIGWDDGHAVMDTVINQIGNTLPEIRIRNKGRIY